MINTGITDLYRAVNSLPPFFLEGNSDADTGLSVRATLYTLVYPSEDLTISSY